MSPWTLDRLRPCALLLEEAGVWDGTQRYPGFEDWCQSHQRQACAVWLSCGLLTELVCDAGMPIADDAVALAWARTQLQHYHGEAAQAWPVAAWQQGQRRGVSALRGLPLGRLREAADRAQVRLRRVSPWWSLVLKRALRSQARLRAARARLLVVEGPRVAVLDLERGGLVGLQLRRLDAADPAALERHAAAGAGPTLAIGYGLADPAAPTPQAAAPVDAIEAIDPLTQAHPHPRWLRSGWLA